ncbi:MAG: hypothetical protein ABI707_01130 [Ferruginibacter sp.]
MATQTNQSDTTDNPKTIGLKEDADQNGDNEITPAELELLDEAGTEESGEDNELLDESMLDGTDEDGDQLNEADDLTGDDLDVPGSETDNEDESIGEEDEENNSYSISDQDDNDEDRDPIM